MEADTEQQLNDKQNNKTMKKTRTIALYLVLALVALFASAVLVSMSQMAQPDLPVSVVLPLMSLALFVCMAFTQRNRSVAQATGGIDVEFWTSVLKEVLNPDNMFMSKSVDHGDSVLNGVAVHIPNAGAQPGVTRDRSSYPATAAQRTDVDLLYALVEYTTDPTHITKKEQTTIAYDKVASILRTHSSAIVNAFAADLNYNWSGVGAGQIVRTTGADSALNLSPSATGTRKIMTMADLSAAMTAMNKQNVPKEDRYALFPSGMYGELLDDPALKVRDYGAEADYKNGILGKLYGFNIMERSESTIFTNAGTPVKRAVGASAAATDNMAALLWQKDAVCHALGTVTPFQDNDNPFYYGDILSALARAGGRQMRNDGKGVISIVQTVGA